MAFTSLSIGDLTPAAKAALAPPAAEPRVELAELGATGTPIFGGFLRELGEYNADLTGLSAYRIYEKMRRGDGQVSAVLMATKLPIRAAKWTVQEPPDATPIEQEAVELVRSCLLEELDFDFVLRNALLMLDFGAAAHEDVYYQDGGRIRLKKLAARLPLTFYRWVTAPGTDDLVALEQQGYRGGDYVTTQVPANKLSLFTFNQEGANFTGISLLRPMYQHWYIKSNLYKIEAIAMERNGMGIPAVKMGPGAKEEDRREALKWAMQMATNQSTGIVLPHEWDLLIKGVDGMVVDPQKAIEHHNLMIAIVGLAQFLNLGQANAGGSRALGSTLSDFFYLGLQATANQIGRVISTTTIRRLCDLNFPGLERYPRLVAQQILSIKLDGVIDAIQKLPGVIRGDDELEAYMRSELGLPEAGDSPRAPAPVVPPAGGAQPEKAAFSEREFALKRAPRGAEKWVAFSAISSELDRGRDEVAAALRKARARVQKEILHKLMARPVAEAHRVSIALDPELVDEIRGILAGLQEYGSRTVADERNKQLAGKPAATARTIRAAAAGGKKDPVGLYADAIVSEFQNNLQQRAANVALDAKRKTAGKATGQAILDAEEELDGQSDKWIDSVASKGANEAFAAGRADGFEEYAEEIAYYIYSAMLDVNCCPNCARADQKQGTMDEIPDAPNPDCDGGDKCRCVVVAVFKDEVARAA